jgi:hypothetical protein
MLFMVIETFSRDRMHAIAERFRQHGRLLPEGVVYQASWIDPGGLRCYQIMEASNPDLLEQWTARWKDLVEFEVVPVVTSAEYWAPGKGS